MLGGTACERQSVDDFRRGPELPRSSSFARCLYEEGRDVKARCGIGESRWFLKQALTHGRFAHLSIAPSEGDQVAWEHPVAQFN